MGRFQRRLHNTKDLAKRSWHVLQHDRELMWLPVLSGIVSVVVIAVFALLAWGTTGTTTTTGGTETTASPATILFGVIGIALLSVVGVFFNGALVAGAHQRMTGGDPTVGSSISRALQRLPGLVGWGLITATVGMIFRLLRGQAHQQGGIAGLIGRLILPLVEMAWEVVAFLTIPAIVIDDAGPIEGFKRSVSLLKATWGENVIAQVGFGLVGIVLVFGGALPLLLITGVLGVIWLGAVLTVLWVAVVLVVLAALSAIFQTALYLYATSGVAPEGFEASALEDAIATR